MCLCLPFAAARAPACIFKLNRRCQAELNVAEGSLLDSASEFWANERVRWDVLDGSTDAIEEVSADLVDWLVG